MFNFKQFSIDDRGCGMKICSDSVLLGAWFFAPYGEAASVIDVGAGSGLLALMAAQCCPSARIVALELEASAAKAAADNFAESPWAGRLSLIEGDFALYQPTEKVDLVVSNPPYFADGLTAPDLARAAARHQSGLSYATLVRYAAERLKSDGHLGVVAPAELETAIVFEAEMCGLKLRRALRVATSPRRPVRRVLLDFSPSDGTLDAETLALRDASGEISRQYRVLTDPFYIKL